MRAKINAPQRAVRLIASSRFFWGIVALLILQAAWLALSGRYPMAFDEDFHFGIIRIYSHQLSPFLPGQPAHADVFGAVARDPSYLYHYLMSFPYRFISLFTHDQTIQVVGLRFIDIAFFVCGLVLFRRLLLKTGAPAAVVHVSLLVFVLLPVVPWLAAQINYDNLLLPLTAGALLLTISFSEEMRTRKRFNTKLLLGLLILCLLTSLVKYAFLPIFAAIVVCVLLCVRQTYPSARKLLLSIGFGFTLITRRVQWALLLGLVVSLALFMQRDGLNLVHYHTPVPDCSKVLSVKECSAYGPWIRDYDFQINKVDEEHSPFVFTADWLYGMWLRLFFAVGGPGVDYQTRGPLLLPALASIGFAAVGAVAAVVYGQRVFKRYNAPVLWLLALTCLFYVAALWLDEYQAYVRTGQPVAINGRYLLPVLLPVLVFSGLALHEALKHRINLQLAVAVVAVVSLAWGGGALTYILRSSDRWNWDNRAVMDANHAVRTVVAPVTPGYRQTTIFLH